jgi:hypothetical protein
VRNRIWSLSPWQMRYITSLVVPHLQLPLWFCLAFFLPATHTIFINSVPHTTRIQNAKMQHKILAPLKPHHNICLCFLTPLILLTETTLCLFLPSSHMLLLTSETHPHPLPPFTHRQSLPFTQGQLKLTPHITVPTSTAKYMSSIHTMTIVYAPLHQPTSLSFSSSALTQLPTPSLTCTVGR